MSGVLATKTFRAPAAGGVEPPCFVVLGTVPWRLGPLAAVDFSAYSDQSRACLLALAFAVVAYPSLPAAEPEEMPSAVGLPWCLRGATLQQLHRCHDSLPCQQKSDP